MEQEDVEKARDLIVTAAEANGYHVEGNTQDGAFEVSLGRRHVVDFQIKPNSSNYLQVHMLEEIPRASDNWEWGRAVYSIRSISDAFLFCNILNSSAAIAAKRQ